MRVRVHGFGFAGLWGFENQRHHCFIALPLSLPPSPTVADLALAVACALALLILSLSISPSLTISVYLHTYQPPLNTGSGPHLKQSNLGLWLSGGSDSIGSAGLAVQDYQVRAAYRGLFNNKQYRVYVRVPDSNYGTARSKTPLQLLRPLQCEIMRDCEALHVRGS